MALGVLVQRREHDWKDNLDVIRHQVAEVLVVPEVKGPLGDLEMRTGHGFGQLVEQRLLHLVMLSLCLASMLWMTYLGKFCRIHHFKDVLYLVQEHDFLGAVHLRPITEQAQDNLFREGSILF
jgi:hypothetical protein